MRVEADGGADGGAGGDATVAWRDFAVMADGRRLVARWLWPRTRVTARAGAALVLLHEGLGGIAQWKGFPLALVARTGLPALVYERWGFGGSEPLELPRPCDYLIHEATRALPAVLAAAAVARPILVGHSDGGSIALIYAARAAERPLACITEAAHVFVEAETLAGIRLAQAAWRDGDLAARLARYHGAKAETVFRGWVETWLRPDFADWRMDDVLPAITCPVLAIQGRDDQYGTAAQIEAIVTGVSGVARSCLLDDCGHAPHHQRPDAVLAVIADFLARHLPPDLAPAPGSASARRPARRSGQPGADD